MSNNFIKEIVSGGQTGVDRAALDAAITFKIPHGGWCPYERKAEDGVISTRYNLKEAPLSVIAEQADPDAIYKKRTELNAKDSDGTLVLVKGSPVGGTLYTIEMLEKYKKPYFIFNLSNLSKIDDIVSWIVKNNIHKLNVAGPRASQTAGIYEIAYGVISEVINHQLLNQSINTQTITLPSKL